MVNPWWYLGIVYASSFAVIIGMSFVSVVQYIAAQRSLDEEDDLGEEGNESNSTSA